MSQTMDPLRPQFMAWTFGRPRPPRGSRLDQSSTPLPIRTPLLAMGVIVLSFAILMAVSLSTVTLFHQEGTVSGLYLLLKQKDTNRQITMGLLEDPVGLVVLTVALLTPLFAARQVDAIRSFVPSNVDNAAARLDTYRPEDLADVNRYAGQANRAFVIFGSRGASFVQLILAASFVGYIYILVLDQGLYSGWHDAGSTEEAFSQRLLDGWWANPRSQPVPAGLLFVACTWMMYMVQKQIIFGIIFSSYAYRALRRDFCVVPNVLADTDGYWGLRNLRGFMQWTYVSTVAHFAVTLGVLAVWLHFSSWTAPAIAMVVAVNGTTVLFPSWMAHKSVVSQRLLFVEQMGIKTYPDEERRTQLKELWAQPGLPFKLRGALSAASIYLFVPVLLLVLSAILKSD